MNPLLKKSQEQAEIIRLINMYLPLLDIEHLKVGAKGLKEEASRYDSMAALNRSYNPSKSNLLYLQARALKYLIDFVETSKLIGELKGDIANTENHYAEMEKLFL